MPIALKFTDNVDPTAVATVALAVITLGLVVVTMLALRQTRQEINLSQQEVEEAHRPVVVPIVDATRRLRPERSDSPPLGPQMMTQQILWVPLENIGSGPALDLEVTIQPSRARPGGSAPEPLLGNIAGLGAMRVLPVELAGYHHDTVGDFDLAMTYSDVAGKVWRTRAGFSAERRRYERIEIGYEDTA